MPLAHPISETNRAAAPYACQSYTHGKPCRYDKRPDDAQCAGCPRSSDLDYLAGQGVEVAKFANMGGHGAAMLTETDIEEIKGLVSSRLAGTGFRADIERIKGCFAFAKVFNGDGEHHCSVGMRVTGLERTKEEFAACVSRFAKREWAC